MDKGLKTLISLFLFGSSVLCYADNSYVPVSQGGSGVIEGKSLSLQCDSSGTALYVAVKNNTSKVCQLSSNGLFFESQLLFEKNKEFRPGEYYYLAFDKGTIWGTKVILLIGCGDSAVVWVDFFSRFKHALNLINGKCNAMTDVHWWGGSQFSITMLKNSPHFPANEISNSPHIAMRIDEH